MFHPFVFFFSVPATDLRSNLRNGKKKNWKGRRPEGEGGKRRGFGVEIMHTMSFLLFFLFWGDLKAEAALIKKKRCAQL